MGERAEPRARDGVSGANTGEGTSVTVEGLEVSEAMGWLATDWNCSARAGTPIVAWKVAKPGDEDEGEGWTVAVGVTAGARATAGSGRT